MEIKINSSIRKQLIFQRDQLNKSQVHTYSKKICRHITATVDLTDYSNIAVYHAIANEVDLSSVFHHKNLYLPVIGKKNIMQFKLFEVNKVLKTNKYGIYEPQNTEIIQAELIELCFIPLVGFNRNGARLGMGGGYYDRYFELNKFKKNPTKLIGIAYDFQENDTIQSQPWDIPMDIVITNNEVIQP